MVIIKITVTLETDDNHECPCQAHKPPENPLAQALRLLLHEAAHGRTQRTEDLYGPFLEV